MTEREIFEKVFSILDPAERKRALVEACHGDTELCARVEELVRLANMRTSGLLNPSWGDVSSQQAGTPDPLINQSIGGVKLVRVINEGGMGRVYEGVQESPRRTVAVKIVKPGIETHKVIRRFEFEAHVLAQLSHPGIGQIFAAGTHGDGPTAQPYFVMEYIAGAKSITKYAEDLKLSNQARLSLFQKVCDAVAYGHQKGVIHRDLKPSNILVNAAGEPKVIDFGIAKTTDSDMALTSMQTDVGRLIGTYQYMSPEQFDADPLAIDVRSDVYALGVVLYELLTGQPPYQLEKRILPEIASIVRQQDPTPITTVNKTLQRDVGVIAGKCLEKDKNRRYSSASELAHDVRSYLAGDPIAAVAPSFWYGVTRLARRHKAAAASVIGIAASLVAAVVGISIAAVLLQKEKTVSERNAGRARQAEEKTRRSAEAEHEQRLIAEKAREEETRQRADAEEARDVATKETLEGKRRLYLAHLYRLQDALASPGRQGIDELFATVRDSHRQAWGDMEREPLEIRLLQPLVHDALAVLPHDDRMVECIAFDPTGSRLATGCHGGSVRIWNPISGKILLALDDLAVHDRADVFMRGVAFSPDGSRVAAVTSEGTACVWDSSTGIRGFLLPVHGNYLSGVAFTRDGARLVTASRDGSVWIWSSADGGLLFSSEALGGGVDGLAISPTDDLMATGGDDCTARLWRTSDGAAAGALEHDGPIHRIVFSRDGTRLAVGSGDSTARIWDPRDGRQIAITGKHDGPVLSVAFTPDGKRLATGSLDGTARLWDATDGRHLLTCPGHGRPVTHVAFNADGSMLATATGDHFFRETRRTNDAVRLWNTSSARLVTTNRGHSRVISSLAFSPDELLLASGCEDGMARIWVPPAGVLGGPPIPANADAYGALSRSGNRIALACTPWSATRRWLTEGSVYEPVPADPSTAWVWELPSGRLVGDVSAQASGLNLRPRIDADGSRVLFSGFDGILSWTAASEAQPVEMPISGQVVGVSPDGAVALVLSREDDALRVIDTTDWNIQAAFPVPTRKAFPIVLNPDGTMLCVGDELWKCATWQRHGSIGGLPGELVNACFSPDGSRLVVGTDKTASIVDTQTLETLAPLDGHATGIEMIAFSADGSLIATGAWDSTIRIWDAPSGRQRAVLEGHQDPISALAFSPDGTRLVSGSLDATVRVWAIPDGTPLVTLRGHETSVTDVVFSADGDWLVTLDESCMPRVWGIPVAEVYRQRAESGARVSRR